MLQIVTIFFAHKLGNYPTSEEFQQEAAAENAEAMATADPLAINPTAPADQFWDITAISQTDGQSSVGVSGDISQLNP